MAFAVNTYSLSALTPLKFVYNYGDKQELKNNYIPFQGGFAYYRHDALVNSKDVALSKKNYVALTEIKELSSVFDISKTTSYFKFGTTAASFYLKIDGKKIVEGDGIIYKGGLGGCGSEGKPILLTVIPLDDNWVELRVGKSKYLKVDSEYPYVVRLTDRPLDPSLAYTKKFKVEYANNKITLAAQLLSEEFRYLAFAKDNVLRAVGLELNNTILNNYHFDIEFVSNSWSTTSTTLYGYIPKTTKIKYFNSLYNNINKTNVHLQEIENKETNLLITCPTQEMSKSTNEVNVNISLLKTNFSSEGTFLEN